MNNPSGQITVCMISCLHPLQDDRIYWKEALSLKKHGYKVIHLGVSDKNQDFISKEGIRLISVKRITYFKNILVDKIFRTLTFRPNVYKKLIQIAEQLQANVYHLHDIQLLKIVDEIKLLKQPPKIIYDVHEPYHVTYATRDVGNIISNVVWKAYGIYIKNWELKKAKEADLIITTEENVNSWFSQKLKQIKSDIIYNYVDEIPHKSSTNKKYDFIYSGGIRRRRGIFEILEAINNLKIKGIQSKTLIIGVFHGKDLKKQVTDYISRNNLSENIDIKNFVPYKEVLGYYSQAKIGLAIFKRVKVNELIMPIKLFEYITFGLPVITSDFGHLKSVTEINQTGLIISPNDKSSICDAMENLLVNNKLYNNLVLNCINAAPKYHWSIMEKRLLYLYQSITFRHQ